MSISRTASHLFLPLLAVLGLATPSQAGTSRATLTVSVRVLPNCTVTPLPPVIRTRAHESGKSNPDGSSEVGTLCTSGNSNVTINGNTLIPTNTGAAYRCIPINLPPSAGDSIRTVTVAY